MNDSNLGKLVRTMPANKQPMRRPGTTRADIWRNKSARVLLLFIACMTISAILQRIWRGATWSAMTSTLLLLGFGICVLIAHGVIYRVVTERKLLRHVEHCIGHAVSSLRWHGAVDELPAGHGGWTSVRYLQTRHGRFDIQSTWRLDPTPKSSNAALIVCDKAGTLHLFRFADANPMVGVHPPMNAIYLQLDDHGKVGPDRFERSMHK